ncbi:MAG: hypothetical protein QM696_12165 [Steroidobacteraceae bacterium]
MIKNRYLVGLLATAVLAFSACSSQQEPATQAFNAAESALASVREDAARYIPEQLKEAEATLAHLKDQLTKKDYRAVIAGAPAFNATVTKLQEEAASRKADFETEWNSVQSDVGKMADAIQSRVDTLAKSRRLPSGITKEAFESAKSGLDQLKATLESAKTTAGSNPMDAVTIAKGAQAKGKEVLQLLGMPAG